MNWERVKLGDICETCLGKMLDKAKNRGELRPYLANLNVRWGEFDTSNLSLMKFEDSELERYGIKYGDLIMCEGGEIGRCAIWKESIPNMMIQKALHRIRPKDERLNIFYLLYWFIYQGEIGAIEQYASGTTTIKHLPAVKLKQIEVDLPPRGMQDKIVSILSAYDELIDNCKQQIALLEEAAQRLYREWFSDFSPNSALSYLAEDVGKSVNKSNRTNYECYTPINCLPKKSLAYIAPKDISLAESSLKSYKPKDILFGAMRVYFHKVCIAQENGLTRSTCIVLNAINERYWAYLILLLFSEETITWATANSKEGTTMPYISWEKFKYMPIYLPDEEVARQFNFIVEPYLSRIIVLAKYIRNLTEIKSVLLPRLISSQTEINA